MKTHPFIRTLFVTASILLVTQMINAQTAVGARFGGTTGVTLKTNLSGDTHMEGILGLSESGLSITGLYEKSKPTSTEVKGLSWYYGAGGHATFGGGDYYRYPYPYEYYTRHSYNGTVGIGIDGILGLEYQINEIPFSISLDLKPYLEINSGGFMYISPDPGLGLKFRF